MPPGKMLSQLPNQSHGRIHMLLIPGKQDQYIVNLLGVHWKTERHFGQFSQVSLRPPVDYLLFEKCLKGIFNFIDLIHYFHISSFLPIILAVGSGN